ncbi:serine/threonine protein kinase [Kitasatospora sp. NBC_01287]|uniref:serine/threonine-protein kinase n=1 Tax=Kitasatospora sp. NBC_01287 TaxID=2903573 RepID=UPI002251DCBB|nr:serine/threonine-protein kinase [Kitasatospora sp. NBC_01287]MCX4750497.1 serine/threonine protein kinase [Kitasatospora sp. NBC_01287]
MLGTDGPTHVGPFRTVGVLGQGGMGQVLLGVAADGRLVAVKRIHADLAEDPGFRSRFRREVDASRRVSGAYTAPVVAADPEAATPWLASVFLPGPTLGEALEAGGALPGATVLLLAAGLARALEDIHRAGLVHRDLKPSNVLLTEDGVRVVDFGIARAADHDTKLTRTGAVIGSPAFMSPEQVLGQEPGPAGDVFSLGVTLATAATGRNPFAGDSPIALMHAVAHGSPDLAALPPGLRRIIEPCLAKEPGLRPTPGQLPALIGPLTAAARPWPQTVYAQIAERRAGAAQLAAAAVPVPAPPLMPPPAPAPAPAPFPPPAPRRVRRWLVTAIVAGVAVLTAAAAVLAIGPANVYYDFFPEPVPTPGSTPLSQVADKYTKTVPTCAQAGRSITVPSGFGDAKGNVPGVFQKSDGDGHTHPETECAWDTRSGDEIDISWDLYLSRTGGPTGAAQAKENYEGEYIRGETRRDPGLDFVQEGLWLTATDGEDCMLYTRDVNLFMIVSIKGTRYPKGGCDDLTKDLARQAVAAVVSL